MPAQIEIAKYIGELLYENDCVIIPGFGGFIGNYAPARIDPVKRLFEPPGKNILFNKGLTQNDGLLAHHISHRRKITYNQALALISAEVERIQAELRSLKRATLEGVGILYTEAGGNMLFQPDEKVNYLPDAFGLAPFYRLPSEQPQPEPTVIPLHKPLPRITTWAAAAAIGAVAASVFWVSFNSKRLGIDYASLNMFAKKEARHYVSRVIQPAATIDFAKDSLNAISFLNTKTAKAPAHASSQGNFVIIAGCFRFLGNAQTLVRKMKQQQVNASIIGTNPQGLYMVGSRKYATREQAEAQLEGFRKSFAHDAWVYVGKAGAVPY